MNASKLVFVASVLFLILPQNVSSFCCLCEHCDDVVPGRGDLELGSEIQQDLTCESSYVHIVDSFSAIRRVYTCGELLAKYRPLCCDPDFSVPNPGAPQKEYRRIGGDYPVPTKTPSKSPTKTPTQKQTKKIEEPKPSRNEKSQPALQPAPKPTPAQTTNTKEKYIGLCCLCENCGPLAHNRGNLLVDQQLTCDLAYNLLFDNFSDLRNEHSCPTLLSKYRDPCCNEQNPGIPVHQAPVPAPTINLSQGAHPKCEVCSNGLFPGKGHNLIAVLYHGTRTCRTLWEEGQTGNLEDKLCNPLQDFAFEVCGCDVGKEP